MSDRMKKRTKRLIQSISGGLIVCLLLGCCGAYGTCEGVRDRVLRLHVIANSDSAEDQRVKLMVRDAILEATGAYLGEADDEAEAAEIARQMVPVMRKAAEETLRREGSDHGVTVAVGEAYFPTREYESVTLPAGEYEAVRVIIGEGKGKNWWCVLFPPLCLGAAAKPRANTDTVLTWGQRQWVKGQKLTVKFLVVEWVESLQKRLRRKG